MIIASSVPTLLGEIIRQSQDIASEARWIEYYAHLNPADIECIEDCVRCIMDDCKVILENINDLRGKRYEIRKSPHLSTDENAHCQTFVR